MDLNAPFRPTRAVRHDPAPFYARYHPDEDCFAARLAASLLRRLGHRARPLAAARLTRAIARRETVKADLYMAVTFVLDDPDGIFRRSRTA